MNKSFYNNLNSLLSIARDLYNRGNFLLSKQKFEQCLELLPDDPLLLFEYGCCLYHLKDYANSIQILNTLISIDTQHARGHALLGTIYSDQGKSEAASRHHYQAIMSAPTLTQSAYGYAKTCRISTESDEYKYILSLIDHPEMKLNDKIRIYFSLAEIHLSNKDYPGQVEFLRLGNQLAGKHFPFNAAAQMQNSTRILQGFSEIDNYELNSQDIAPATIFILGLPRCGSTLLEQMLSAHSEIGAIGETENLSRSIGLIQNNDNNNIKLPEEVSRVQSSSWKLGREFYNKQSSIDGTKVVVDKQLFNFTLTGFAKMMIPSSVFIDLRRSPASQFISCYGILFGENRGFTHSVENFVAAYHNQRKLIDYWKQKFPQNFKTVYYEDLVMNPKQILEDILAKVDCEFEEDCLAFHLSKQLVTSASQLQVKQPLYSGSIDRWLNYQEIMQHENKMLQPIIDDYVKEMELHKDD
jgi:tetratricopeptide (TPR) repeat protein